MFLTTVPSIRLTCPRDLLPPLVITAGEEPNGLNKDCIQSIFIKILSNSDFKSLSALGRTNKFCYVNMWESLKGVDIKQLCPQLTILESVPAEELKSKKIEIIKFYFKAAPNIENNAGLTLYKTDDRTLNQLIADIQKAGIDLEIRRDKILKVLGNLSVQEPGLIMVTNARFKKMYNGMSHDEMDYLVIKQMGFDKKMELFDYLHVITAQKTSDLETCLFRLKTCGCTSTKCDRSIVTFGNQFTMDMNQCAPRRVAISFVGDYLIHKFAGGRKKF